MPTDWQGDRVKPVALLPLCLLLEMNPPMTIRTKHVAFVKLQLERVSECAALKLFDQNAYRDIFLRRVSVVKVINLVAVVS